MKETLKVLAKPFCNHAGGGDGTEIVEMGASMQVAAIVMIIAVSIAALFIGIERTFVRINSNAIQMENQSINN